MPREDGYASVLVYYLVLAVVVAGIHLFWGSLLDFADLSSLIRRASADDAGSGLIEFLLSPLFAIIGLYMVAGVVHLLLLMMRGAQHGFETTTRVFAFSYSPSAFAIVPVIGPIVGFIWMVVLSIIGLREAHETDGAKAATAVLVPVFLLIGLLVLATLAAITLGLLKTRI